MIKQRRDANEPEIVDALRKAGRAVIYMDKSAGFDLLVINQHVHIIEVKMPAKFGNLTDNEKATKAAVEKAGGIYNVVTTPEMALQVTE